MAERPTVTPGRGAPGWREGFSWHDGERLVRFGAGALAQAPRLLAERGFERYALLTTARAEAAAPALAAGAGRVLHVAPGLVEELSGALLGELGEAPPVALGGGRVVDVAKALAGAAGVPCAAVPTTLAGAPLTPFHRTPTGVPGARLVRPALVVVEPELAASQPPRARAASAMNALAHALESLYAPGRNPVAELAALEGARRLGETLPAGERADRAALVLGALLTGYAVGLTGLAIHHALCQTLVRVAGTPHAETNAVLLPHSARLMAPRAPRELGLFAAALGGAGRPDEAPALVARLAAEAGPRRLSELGVRTDHVDPAAATALRHPGAAATPDPPSRAELRELLEAAL